MNFSIWINLNSTWLIVSVSKINVERVPTIPTNRFTCIITIYALLGTSNTKDIGYINGIMDQLKGFYY